jgi:hypothetical protein
MELHSTDFEAYIRCFKQGLLEEQVEMIKELFLEHPVPNTGPRERRVVRP